MAVETGVKRKLEKDIEEELGDDYILDLKKNYDIPDEYKYDNVPEFLDGKNIADYIDMDILKVRFLFSSELFFDQKLIGTFFLPEIGGTGSGRRQQIRSRNVRCA